jgi:hypothetical protein
LIPFGAHRFPEEVGIVKQNVSPAVLISVIAAVVVLVGIVLFRAMTAPSSVPVPASQTKDAMNPRTGGGPTEEDLKRMREYNAANPGAASSHR